MAKIHRFEDIEAWQLARELTGEVYQLTLKEDFKKTSNLTTKVSIFLFGLLFGIPRLLNPLTF
jgi:hypothetical protein